VVRRCETATKFVAIPLDASEHDPPAASSLARRTPGIRWIRRLQV